MVNICVKHSTPIMRIDIPTAAPGGGGRIGHACMFGCHYHFELSRGGAGGQDPPSVFPPPDQAQTGDGGEGSVIMDVLDILDTLGTPPWAPRYLDTLDPVHRVEVRPLP